jgi:hypothetical protein
MSLLKKIKENISKREEEAEEVNEENEDEEEFVEIPTMLPSFIFYGHNWLVAPFMSEIVKGRFDLIPVECVLTMYILRCYNICYYVVLDNSETGDDFSVYEFEWIGADGERANSASEHGERANSASEHGERANSASEHGERAHSASEHGEHEHIAHENCANKEKQEEKDPEFIEYATNMTALDAGKFLRDRISEGYYIYIQERL